MRLFDFIDNNNRINDEKTDIEQLRKDKYRLLEGYVPELLLYNQFLKDGVNEFSKGWWMSLYNGKYIFFCLSAEPSPFEVYVAGILKSIGQVWFVSDKNGKWIFSDLSVTFEQSTFLRKMNITEVNRPMIADESVRDHLRQTQAIDYFKAQGILNSIARERRFANNFLSVYFKFPCNIDFFYRKNDLVRVGEVKFKYPTYNGKYGIDYGQLEMFRTFMALELKIYYFILYKTRRDKDWSIFDFLKSNDEKVWFYTKLTANMIENVSEAPKDTSINGVHSQKYYSIDKSNFIKYCELIYNMNI